MLKGLDEIDQMIIDLLLEDARISYVDIADKVHLSRVAVKSRIKALEDEGVIEKYVTVINPDRMDNIVSIFFDMEFEPSRIEEASEIMVKNPAFVQILRVTGPCKLHVHAIIGVDDDMEILLRDVVYKLPGLKRLSYDTVIGRIKDVKGMRI